MQPDLDRFLTSVVSSYYRMSMESPAGIEAALKPHARFDYGKFQSSLRKRFDEPKPLEILKERVVNAVLERTGKRSHECGIRVSETGNGQRILFVNEKGETLDPVADFIDPVPARSDLSASVSVAVVPGGDTRGNSSTVRGTVSVPEQWVDPRLKHQGLKYLHELGHLAIIREDPNRRYVYDDLQIQQYIAETLLIAPDTAHGTMLAILQQNMADGLISDLGINDPQAVEQYLRRQIDTLGRICRTDNDALLRVYGEISMNVYIQKVQMERDAWASALHMYRRARERGFFIDNRTSDEISMLANASIATRVTPEWTFAVRGKARQKLGLPPDAEAMPTVSSFPVEAAVADLERRRQFADHTADAIRHHLQMDGAVNGISDETVTPIEHVDARAVHPREGLFSSETPPPITREGELQVRVTLSAARKWIQGMARRHVEEHGRFMEETRRNAYVTDPKLIGKVQYELISDIPDRRFMNFCLTDIGNGYDSRAVYSYAAVMDTHVDADTYAPVPADAHSEHAFLFATRVTPETPDDGYVGMQLVGTVPEIMGHTGATTLRQYLTDHGYDPDTLGTVSISQLGFSMFRGTAGAGTTGA